MLAYARRLRILIPGDSFGVEFHGTAVLAICAFQTFLTACIFAES